MRCACAPLYIIKMGAQSNLLEIQSTDIMCVHGIRLLQYKRFWAQIFSSQQGLDPYFFDWHRFSLLCLTFALRSAHIPCAGHSRSIGFSLALYSPLDVPRHSTRAFAPSVEQALCSYLAASISIFARLNYILLIKFSAVSDWVSDVYCCAKIR